MADQLGSPRANCVFAKPSVSCDRTAEADQPLEVMMGLKGYGSDDQSEQVTGGVLPRHTGSRVDNASDPGRPFRCAEVGLGCCVAPLLGSRVSTIALVHYELSLML